MLVPDLAPELLAAAHAGQLAALETLATAIQPGIFNLAVRMLGHREDAQDACQEILLKVVTRLGGFRGEAAFSTWVYQVARNHLLTAATRAREAPEVSFDELARRLGEGLAYEASLDQPTTLTPADRAEAREVAVRCTQGMLLRLDRGHRLAYLLDVVFGLAAEQAAAVLEISPVAYRKRLSRARAELRRFAGAHCGWVNPRAACRCARQLPGLRLAEQGNGRTAAKALPLAPEEAAEAERLFARLAQWSEAAAVFRAHPAYRSPQSMQEAVREVLRGETAFSHGTV